MIVFKTTFEKGGTYMDAVTLVHQVMNTLTPFLESMGTATASKIGEDVYEHGKKLYILIRDRFAHESDGKASKALQMFENDPDAGHMVETKLLRLVQNDLNFAEALYHAIQAGPQMSIEGYDKAKILRNTMENAQGRGSQKIVGKNNAEIVENQMKIKYE